MSGRRMAASGMGPRAAAVTGTREVFFAVMTTTATLAAVFIPISFLPGQAGTIFKEFGFVLTFSITLSSVAALVLAPVLAAMLDPGDEVLLPAPYWTTYPEAIRLAGGCPVEVLADETQDYLVTVEQLEAARTERTKVLLFCSPSNPTGTVIPTDWVEACVRRHPHTLFVVDESFIDFSGQTPLIERMEADPVANVIIIKKKKAHGHGHHSSAWKVAFADFMTAMMAFFLLMWLLETATPKELAAISGYFQGAESNEFIIGPGGADSSIIGRESPSR